MRGCWNWQTGRLEVPVFEKTYGFKSHAPHQKNLICGITRIGIGVWFRPKC